MVDEGFKPKLAAILSADAIEYNELMGEDEEATAAPSFTYPHFKGTCHE